MNRRSFLSDVLKAGVAFTVLPPATTYSRIWRAQRPPLKLVPFWIETRLDPYGQGLDLEYIKQLILQIQKYRESQPGYDPNVITFQFPLSRLPI